MAILEIMRTLFSRFLLLIIFPFFALAFLLCLLFTRGYLVDNRFYMIISRFFYWFIIKFAFIPIIFKGIAHIPEEPVIVVANHQSSFDVPLIGYILRKRPHIWLAWSELLKDKLLRYILPRISIPVDTSSPVKGLRTLVNAITVLQENRWDVIIFPEGGRFIDGQVHEFMAGYAVIARKTQRPVVPVKIIGVDKAYPPHSFIIHFHPILVIIGEPLWLKVDETDEAFNQRVYNWFVQIKG